MKGLLEEFRKECRKNNTELYIICFDKYNSIYDPKDDLLEYQYKILNTRKKNVKSSLTFLGKENGIEHDYESLHDAINDLDLNLKVWNKLKWQIEV